MCFAQLEFKLTKHLATVRGVHTPKKERLIPTTAVMIAYLSTGLNPLWIYPTVEETGDNWVNFVDK